MNYITSFLTILPLLWGQSFASQQPTQNNSKNPLLENTQASNQAPSLCSSLTTLSTLYKDKESFFNEVKLIAIGQAQIASVNPNGANKFRSGSGGHNDEVRRTYLGFSTKMFNDKLAFKTMNDVGELPSRNITNNEGDWKRTRTDWLIYELSLTWTEENYALAAGKLTPDLTVEYEHGSTTIKTVERSALVNQLGSTVNSNWGLEGSLFFPHDKLKDKLECGLYLNGDGKTLHRSFQFNSEANAFSKIHYVKTLQKGETLQATYAHNFSSLRETKIPSYRYYEGMGEQDMIALAYEYEINKQYFLAQAFGGYGVFNNTKAKNVHGISLIEAYKIIPQIELVARYELSFGRDSVSMNNRYVNSVTTYPRWVSCLNSFYIGANFSLCPEKFDFMKLMTGLEYTTTDLNSTTQKAYNGWTLFGGIRFNF